MKRVLLLSIIIIFNISYGQDLNKNNNINGYTSTSFININNIRLSINNNSSTNVYNSFLFPKSIPLNIVTAEGFLFGVKLKNEIYPRVGGSYYYSGLQPGIIKNDGTPSDPNSVKYRVYLVRSDVYPGGGVVDLSDDANLFGTDVSAIRLQFEKDWNEWPAELGAPFNDINKNRIYEPSIDIPGIPGADETLWYVANDLDSNLTRNFVGADPIGVEIQGTIWAYNVNGPFGNTIFRKYKLINKSKSQYNPQGITYDSMFVAFFADADIGQYYINDVQGSDSSLSLSYMYNSSVPPKSIDYRGYPEPSLGMIVLSGPTVDSIGDTAIVDGNIIIGKKNLKAASAFYTNRYENYKSDPQTKSIMGSQHFYNLFNGKYSRSGLPFYDPVNQRITKFSFDGDPITNTGWIERINANDDKRYGIASGPFTIAPGDTQQVVFAEFAVLANDRISSVKEIRYTASVIRDFYKNKSLLKNIPEPIALQTSSNENGIRLNWGYDQSMIDKIENFNSNGYQFQGYNIYQLQFPYFNIHGYKNRISTFDKIDGIKSIPGLMMDSTTGYPTYDNIQFGNDTGLKRDILIPLDQFSNSHFIIGKTYYFGVSAYTYNSNPAVLNKTTESLIIIIPVIFRPDYQGKKYLDTLNVIHISGNGNNNGIVMPIVLDPEIMSKNDYQVSFNYADSGKLVWNLIDETNNKVILENQNLPPDIFHKVEVNNLDGIKLLIRGTKDIPDGPFASKMIVSNDKNRLFAYGGIKRNSKDTLDLIQDLEFRFTGVPQSGASDPNDTLIVSGGSYATIYNINMSKKNKIRIPFELWEIERNRQINTVILEQDFYNINLPPWGKDGIPLWFNNNIRVDIIIPVAVSYNPNYSVDDIDINNNKTTWNVFINGRWATGDILDLYFDNPLSDKDVYIFSTNPLNQFNVPSHIPENFILKQNYPNPFNPFTTIIYSIPENGFISLDVYNILGQKVKTEVNKIESKGFHQILLDFSNYSSGVYIYTLNFNNEFKSVKKMVLLK